MIVLHPVVFLLLTELLVIFAALTALLFWRARRRKAPEAGPVTAPSAAPAHGARLDVGNYLGKELEQTRARLHHPLPAAGAAGENAARPSPPGWLALRAEYLQVELDLANHEPGDAAWEMLERRLTEIAGKRLAPTENGGSDWNSDRVKTLLTDHDQHIGDLTGFLQDLEVHPEKAVELEQHLGKLKHVNEELAGCVSVLEGENDRLWQELQAQRAGTTPVAPPAVPGGSPPKPAAQGAVSSTAPVPQPAESPESKRATSVPPPTVSRASEPDAPAKERAPKPADQPPKSGS
ncbi:MAG: hypothetical protein B7Z66_05745 [Chromatiales bacterium 21-64-14]|nr:MAG: hypothetical protein B7Z66_05745 [Chromatiales bacterium 21-64-14]HQU15195.1 hypothetical protein [Gammaproteobacteria bacterium]